MWPWKSRKRAEPEVPPKDLLLTLDDAITVDEFIKQLELCLEAGVLKKDDHLWVISTDKDGGAAPLHGVIAPAMSVADYTADDSRHYVGWVRWVNGQAIREKLAKEST
jgi:hypothetical protein